MEKQHEDDNQTYQRCHQEGARCRLLTLKLPSVFHMITLGQVDMLRHSRPDVVDHSTKVASTDICRDDNLALHILATYRIGARGGTDSGKLTQSDWSTGCLHSQVFDILHGGALIVSHLECYIECTVAVIYLRHGGALKQGLYV